MEAHHDRRGARVVADLRSFPVFRRLLVLSVPGCFQQQPCSGQDRSFEISYPYFAACGALHVPDVASLFLEGDPLGLRGRMSFFYSRPAFNTAGQIRGANEELCSQGQLSEDVATFFWPCHTTHDPLWAGLERFVTVKGYPFRVYTLSEAARGVFDTAFDYHVAKQKEAHLVDQELAKYHGKAKTKHVRLALALDSVSAALARFYASVLADAAPSPSPSGHVGKQSARQQLVAVLEGEWSFFTTISTEYKVLFWKLCHEVLRLDSVWLENVALTRLSVIKSLLAPLPDQGATILPRTANLLEHLGLVSIVKGSNVHGTPLFFMVKRHLSQGMLGYNQLVDLLGHFDIGLAVYKTFPTDAVENHKPAKAAAMPRFANVNEDVLRARSTALSDWRELAVQQAAPPAAAVPPPGPNPLALPAGVRPQIRMLA